jgi:hypothetical protein
MELTWLQRLLGTISKGQVDKSHTAVLKDIPEWFPILVFDYELQVATPLLILRKEDVQKDARYNLLTSGSTETHLAYAAVARSQPQPCPTATFLNTSTDGGLPTTNCSPTAIF